MNQKAIDIWVNVSMGALAGSDFIVRIKEDYFKGGEEFFKNIGADEMIATMDKAGVEKVLFRLRNPRYPGLPSPR